MYETIFRNSSSSSGSGGPASFLPPWWQSSTGLQGCTLPTSHGDDGVDGGGHTLQVCQHDDHFIRTMLKRHVSEMEVHQNYFLILILIFIIMREGTGLCS